MVGRSEVEIPKENLVCGCNTLKADTLLGKKLYTIEKSNARYLVGKVLINKENKGIYQYVKTGSGIRSNTFMYFNGTSVYLLNNENLTLFADSLNSLGIKRKDVNRIIPAIKKSMSMPVVNTTDSF